MLSISNLSYFIGERVLLDSAQLYIKPKEKIGLVGLNGAGKTTLLRIINGELTPDHGEVSRSNDCSIGYLNQDLLSFNSHESIVSVVMDAFL
jgi:ATP-binding cassette subfamily F protein 3